MDKVTARVIAVFVVISGCALVGLLFLQLTTKPMYEFAVIAPRDENLGAELVAQGSIGFQIASCRRAVMGEGEAQYGAYECIMQRVRR